MRESVSKEQEHIKGAFTADEVCEGKNECKGAGKMKKGTSREQGHIKGARSHQGSKDR
jgi:hypothetical protein